MGSLASIFKAPKAPKIAPLPDVPAVQRDITGDQQAARARTRQKALASAGAIGNIKAGELATPANLSFKTLLGQ